MLVEEQQWYYLTHNGRYSGVHAFPKGISPKVNIISLSEFEHSSNVDRVMRNIFD